MSSLIFANDAHSTLAGAITNVSTTINLSAGGGALFPNPTTGQYFVATIVDAATGLLKEIVWVTAKSGDTFTVVRSQEGTTALNWSPGDLIGNLWTAGQAAAMQQQSAVPSSLIYYGNDAGTVNFIVASVSPSIASYAKGNIFEITPLYANTNATVLVNISGLGAVGAYRADGTSLVPGDIQPAPYKALFAYDPAGGGKMLLLNPSLWITLNANHYGVDTGSVNTIVSSAVAPPLVSLSAGTTCLVVAANAVTGASTANIAGTGTFPILRYDTRGALNPSDIAAGMAAFLFYDGAGHWILLNPAIAANRGYRSTLYIAGNLAWTVPDGITKFRWTGWAAGGGGGAAPSGSSGGGGAGGEYGAGEQTVTPGSVINFTVGAGGAAGSGGSNGGDGGDTLIGSYQTLKGGQGGQSVTGTGQVGTGGQPRNGSGGNIRLSGFAGSSGSSSPYEGGFGGAAVFGGSISPIGPGYSGLFPGGGGGGATANTSPSNGGAAGYIVVEY